MIMRALNAMLRGLSFQFNSVSQSNRLFVTPWTTAHQASLSITNSRSLLKLMSVESVMPSNHFILCLPLLLLISIFPSIRVFSNESAFCIRWPKDWSFSFNICPSNEHSGQISFRMHWLDLLAVQGALKSLLQHHSSKASLLWHSAFIIVQLSEPYVTTGKIIALTRWTFVGKVIFLLFNILSRLVITFLSRSKCAQPRPWSLERSCGSISSPYKPNMEEKRELFHWCSSSHRGNCVRSITCIAQPLGNLKEAPPSSTWVVSHWTVEGAHWGSWATVNQHMSITRKLRALCCFLSPQQQGSHKTGAIMLTWEAGNRWSAMTT